MFHIIPISENGGVRAKKPTQSPQTLIAMRVVKKREYHFSQLNMPPSPAIFLRQDNKSTTNTLRNKSRHLFIVIKLKHLPIILRR
jgi:hypothetical protein